jgi:putative ABC transport system permease protein
VRRILVVAFPPEDLPFTIGNREDISRALRAPDTILFDRLSRPIYPDVVDSGSAELNGENYRVAGTVDLGPDIIHDGAVVMSDASWFQRYPNAWPIMGVIRVAQGADIEAVRTRLVATLPDDVSFFTPEELRQREFDFTLRSAPIGILFGIGMLAGLVIGAITCYQILFNEIVDRIKQYATLKAMGFSDLFLKGIILEQALLLACGGFLGGLALAAIGYFYIAGRTQLAVELSFPAMALVFLMAAGMSVVAALLALRRVTAADPAELY